MDLGYYFKVFMRRLPYFLMMFLLGSAIGISLAVLLPSVYRAEALLVVESEQIPDELAPSTVQTGAVEQMQIIQQRVQTRDILLEMANRLGIYANTGRAPLTADEKVEDLRERIDITITGGGDRRVSQAMLVRVSFEAETSQMAATVANELVTLILRENVEMRTTVAGQTLDFFSQEVERLSRSLTDQSSKMLKFQEENLNALPDSLEFRRSQQAAQQERLLQLQRGETVLLDRRDRLVTLFENTGRVDPGTGEAPRLSPEAEQLQQLKRQYTNLAAVLSTDNPKLSVLKSRIAALEQIVAEQTDPAAAAENGQPSLYEVQLADIDGQLAFIAEQKEQIRGTLAELRSSIEKTPGNAITLEAMEREYDNTRTLYNQAVANRARAETGDTIESLSKGRRITVLEQAVAPREPTSPNRPLVAIAGIAGGLVAGLGLIVLLEVTNTSVRRPVDLTSKLGITAFGTVPYIWTGPQLVRRRAIITTAVLALVAGIPAGLWLIDTQVTPLQPLISRLLNRLNLDLAEAAIGTAHWFS